MIEATTEAEAIGWIVRLRDAAPEDWVAFTEWLEASPANAAAYDAVTLADAAMVAAVRRPTSPQPKAGRPAANDNAAGFSRRYGALAAALVLCVFAYPTYRALVPTYIIETALGEQRSVTLDDGTVIDLNGGTRLTLDRRNPRLATLDTGEARFRVTHDGKTPFAVIVGGVRVEDAGTVFNIARERDLTEVSVAEGAVIFNPEQEAVLLKPGQRLVVRGSAKPTVGAVNPADVAGWTNGRLDFEATPLADIGPDLSRALGTRVSVDPAIAGRQFTGTIIIDRKGEAEVSRIASLMGVAAEKTGQGWRLSAK